MDELNLVLRLAICGIISGFALALMLSILLIALKISIQQRKKKQSKRCSSDQTTVGFFHPYCNAGGGGERVLWCAVRAIQLNHPKVKCIIYTGDYDSTPEDILSHAEEKFNIVLPKEIDFIFLRKRECVEARSFPYFTLLCQSIGSMVLAYEAVNAYCPDVFIDSMGYSFSYFIFKSLAGCKVGCYVHYPTISTDMLSIVSDRTGSFNNRAIIANSTILTNLKLLYYRFFAWSYGRAGACADVVMANSTWTKGHIETLWGGTAARPIMKIFPPCDVRAFLEIPLERSDDIKTILSISQFRPEKNHKLQLWSFAKFLSTTSQDQRRRYRLVLAGGCRNEGDKCRVSELKALAEQLGVADLVQIKMNVSFAELKELLSTSHIGIHTMTNEHFGIGIVEFQAAGVIALAHNSGGPKMDIVVEEGGKSTGFLAETVQEYSKAMGKIFGLSASDKKQVAICARQACKRFSENQFELEFLHAVKNLLQ